MTKKLPFIWDYNLDENDFEKILMGNLTIGNLDKKWAMIRLIEYASYQTIIKYLGYKEFYEIWPSIKIHIRSESRKRGFDFLFKWLKERHPEKI